MILNQSGEKLKVGGKVFSIGGEVFANRESEYAGLWGTVLEIRDGADRESGNEDPDIHCEFQAPETPDRIADLEETFSDLYQQPKSLEDITLDEVIMWSDILEPVPAELEDVREYLYTLTAQYETDCCIQSVPLGVSTDMGVLLRKMRMDLESYEIKTILTHTSSDIYGWCFIYEAENTGVEDLCISYTLRRTPVLQSKEGGMAA